jgi:TRAP-type transport system periplasmic protein
MDMRVVAGALAGASMMLALPVAAQTAVRIAHATPEASPIHQSLLFFEKELEARSNGAFEVQIFPGGQLGSVQEAAELVQSGNIDMAMGASVLLSPIVPELGVLDMFLLFQDEEHARDVLDGPAGDALLKAMEARGLKGIGFMELGFRSFSNSRGPLDSLEAFSGLRMRSADNPVQIKAWRSIGAVPVPLAWGEIYSSLQQNLIDGQESALSSIKVERFFEVQDYVSLTGHIYWPEVWFANLGFFDDLSPEEQGLLMAVASETVALQRRLTAEANAATLGQLEEAGLEINELPLEDRKRMGEIMNSAIEQDIKAQVGEEFFNSFVEAIPR